MRGLMLGVLLMVGTGVASANPIGEVGTASVDAVKYTGSKAGEVITWAVIGTDKVLEWTNAFLHDKIVHPAVEMLTLGSVSL